MSSVSTRIAALADSVLPGARPGPVEHQGVPEVSLSFSRQASIFRNALFKYDCEGTCSCNEGFSGIRGQCCSEYSEFVAQPAMLKLNSSSIAGFLLSVFFGVFDGCISFPLHTDRVGHGGVNGLF